MKKVILITGASSGMGKETAKKLIQKGHNVYTVARRIDQMQDLKALGGFPLQMDVKNEANIDNVVNTIIQKEGKIEVLWNNAGFGLYGSVEDVPLSAFNQDNPTEPGQQAAFNYTAYRRSYRP